MGSSPLTRGKPDWRRVRRVDDRLIPAQAGKTSQSKQRNPRRRAHPRSREENIDAWELPERHVGSSPLRGENVVCFCAPSAVQGSSPLTQGKRLNRQPTELVRGFIPAHAGKTGRFSYIAIWCWAHPRSRGENRQNCRRARVSAGSCPLTRGKRDFARDELGCVGLIPAHAGKTSSSHCTKTTRQAHPRSRRENVVLAEGVGPAMGSSPLTRGQLLDLATGTRDRGLIPAYTGKTRQSQTRSCDYWAHPRSHGEN